LSVRKGDALLGSITFDARLAGRVSEMYRHVNLREIHVPDSFDDPDHEADKEEAYPPRETTLDQEPAVLPDEETNGDWFIFLHGYNVNGMQARGWADEAFKRFWQCGSNARFVGVSWVGDESQDEAISLFGVGDIGIKGRLTPKFYKNVQHALFTAGFMRNKFNSLPGRKVFAAHSLGCMVLAEGVANRELEADRILLFDPAFATETLLPRPGASGVPEMPILGNGAMNDIHMRHPLWQAYPEETWATEWHRLFPQDDPRSNLTWRGRFTSAIPKMTVFYSPGEEVLSMHPAGDMPGTSASIITSGLPASGFPSGKFSWAVGQKITGRFAEDVAAYYPGYTAVGGAERTSAASPYGGWGMEFGNEIPNYGEQVIVDYFVAGPGVPPSPIYGPVFKEPQFFIDAVAQDRPGFLARLRRDPFFGTGTPANCVGLFDPVQGAQAASIAPVQRTVLSQMIPCRTLPAGGAGGSGVDGIPSLRNKLLPLGIQIDTIDMQSNQNGWPTEARSKYKDDTLSWLHSDIKNVALTYTWNVMKLAVSRGELDKPVPLKP
jgi:hypothetical protein